MSNLLYFIKMCQYDSNSNRSSILELHVLDNVLTEFSRSCRAGKQELQSLKSDDHPQTGRSRVDPPFHFLQN